MSNTRADCRDVRPPRVAVLIHYSPDNYGNHLVNLAVRHVCEQSGLDVDLIQFVPRRRDMMLRSILILPRRVARVGRTESVGSILRKLLRRVVSRPSRKPESDVRRLTEFRAFADHQLGHAVTPVRSRKNLARQYQGVVIGGDQIWNPNYDLGPWQFADFIDSSRVFFMSPSVGHSTVPLEWRPFFRKQLSRFSYVASREDEWFFSLGDWNGMPGLERRVDPTLLLSKEEWLDLARAFEPAATKHVLIYLLGPATPRIKDFVEQPCRLHSLEPRWLCAAKGGDLWASDAAGFLGLIRDADCVVTDSFHGAVFSILFDRPVNIFLREGAAASMNTRMRTLAEQLSLHEHIHPARNPSDALVAHYAEAAKLLKIERRHYRESVSRYARFLARVKANG